MSDYIQERNFYFQDHSWSHNNETGEMQHGVSVWTETDGKDSQISDESVYVL